MSLGQISHPEQELRTKLIGLLDYYENMKTETTFCQDVLKDALKKLIDGDPMLKPIPNYLLQRHTNIESKPF